MQQDIRTKAYENQQNNFKRLLFVIRAYRSTRNNNFIVTTKYKSAYIRLYSIQEDIKLYLTPVPACFLFNYFTDDFHVCQN